MSEDISTGEHVTEAAAPVDSGHVDLQSGAGRDNQMVPLDALQAERTQRQNLQEELRAIKDHIALMQTQQMGAQKAQQEEFSDDDVLTYGDLKKALNQKEQQIKVTLDELKMVQKHPDYEEVVTNYLPEVLKQNPGLRKSLQQTQDYELAYYLAKNSDAYKTSSKTQKKHADAERIVKNAQQAGSLSSVGTTSPVNNARRYKDMSDDEFSKMVSKNLGYR